MWCGGASDREIGGSSPARRRHVAALWTAVFVTVLWSSSWVLIRFGLDDEGLSPLTFAGMRYVLAAGRLVGVVIVRPSRRAEVSSLDRRTALRSCLLGVVLYSLTQGAQFVAIDNQPAATTSLVLSLTPLLVALFAMRALGERATARQVTGAVIVIVGAAAILVWLAVVDTALAFTLWNLSLRRLSALESAGSTTRC